MTILQILHTIVLGPLELLFDVVYAIANGITNNPGLSLIFLSLTINLLVLPLYRRADAMQEEERDQSLRLKPGVDHIRKVFKGDERFMMLQTFYRQNDYKPYYALKGSLSLLLEIPFFIAAYHYLSNLNLLNGASFGPIANLGAPDNLIKLGGISLHLLPILMTAINIVSGIIYTKGMPLKSKIQLYGMALIFLVLLYESPAGLVFYWTLNNLFSLVKNIFYKIPNPKKVIKIICSITGIAVLIAGFMYYTGFRRKALSLIVALVLQLPLLKKYFKKGTEEAESTKTVNLGNTGVIFYVCCLLMTVLVGVLIPSAIISTSTAEFVEMSNLQSPLRYVLHTALMAIGTFMVWFVVFYKLSSDKAKKAFSLGSAILTFCSIVEYMFFGKGYGNISSLLKYDDPLEISSKDYLVNLLILCLVASAVYLIWKKGKEELVKAICIIGCIAISVMSLINVFKIRGDVADLKVIAEQRKQDAPQFTLSKTGQNVVVLMMDRALGALVPYLMEEKPELKKQFAGFTYYPNTFSFGLNTNAGAPPLFGGYEYTPYEMNERADESLKDKNNEALKVMPVLFMNEGYKVTVCDPPYANYQWTPDLSIFDEYPEINAYITHGAFNEDQTAHIAQKDKTINRNLFCYSLFRICPVFLHKEVYNDGVYNYADHSYTSEDDDEWIMGHTSNDLYTCTGVNPDFVSSFNTLKNLSTMTNFTDSDENTYLSLMNTVPHDITMLQEPEFEPRNHIDNTAYEEAHAVRTAPGKIDLEFTYIDSIEHYQCNMAGMIQLGKWFDYLRENGVWDNTRIIIVADHGRAVGLGYLICEGTTGNIDPMNANPLLMIKDFGSKDFTVDDTFMTNADVPTEAFKDLIDNPVNPFTGVPINEDAKKDDVLYGMSTEWSIEKNNGNTFSDPIRYSIKNHNIFDADNWSFEE
ncbi:membrane protein insertase YidC [Butyrivibrio sp. X503]|uniref:membrane protein insertase YidC n=1 Tax=Butyrivibrio sp. X503 TaxID=2364878 RepID=UPI000EAA97D2|nr:membrane protein insertase YidC [Butyrivibrio sp. X503]RKM54455.1 membrane protein insertase YidC [Butyrivibrio sp. X503]